MTSPPKLPVAKGQRAHVRPGDRQGSVVGQSGLQKNEGEIATDGMESFRGELGQMSPRAACEIEDGAMDCAALTLEEGDLLPRFMLVAMRVKLEVVLAEPFLKPSHRRRGTMTED